MSDLNVSKSFDPAHGAAVPVAPNVLRVTAPNEGPFTFTGTNSYVVGGSRAAVVDPGPASEAHLQTLLNAIGGRPVEMILLTHTHLDHTGLAGALKQATGAELVAEGPHRAARPLHEGETNAMDAGGDRSFRPDRTIADGDVLTVDGMRIEAVATPGHTANHLAFALPEAGILLSGDHVMGWSTTIVAPPDGNMSDYMASLDRLSERWDRLYLPGHGGAIERPRDYLRGLKSHRKMREKAILERLAQGDRTIPEIVRTIYRTTDPKLHGAAGLSVLAHLEDLVARGLVAADGPPLLSSRYTPA